MYIYVLILLYTHMCVYVYVYTHLRSSCMWYVYICVCIYAHLCLYAQRLDKDVKCFSLLLSALFLGDRISQ